VLGLSSLDLEEIGDALADQTDYEHQWLINRRPGKSRSGHLVRPGKSGGRYICELLASLPDSSIS